MATNLKGLREAPGAVVFQGDIAGEIYAIRSKYLRVISLQEKACLLLQKSPV